MGLGTPWTSPTIALKLSHLGIQRVQFFGQLLDSHNHVRIAWDTHRRTVGHSRGPSPGLSMPFYHIRSSGEENGPDLL